jgi:hypothetical protein
MRDKAIRYFYENTSGIIFILKIILRQPMNLLILFSQNNKRSNNDSITRLNMSISLQFKLTNKILYNNN